MDKVSIFLVDWQVLFREGIHFTLSGEEDIEVIGEATANEEALAFIETNLPRIVVLNTDHGKPTGIEVTRRIKQNQPGVAVILIMDNDNEDELLAAAKSGDSACLTKNVDPKDVVDTIRSVAGVGKPIVAALLRPGIAARVLQDFEVFASLSQQVGNLLSRLSPREVEIMRHIVDKNSLAQIAQAMGISEGAVNHHLEFVLHKLVTNDHNREVIAAAQSGLLSVIPRPGQRPAAEFVTREEFNDFKEKLMARFKSLVGELS